MSVGETRRGGGSPWWWLILALLLGWNALVAIPVSPVEGDGEAIAMGAERIVQEGPKAAMGVYRFESQAGTYWWLVLLRKVTGGDPLVLFAVSASVSAAVFALFGGALLRRELDVPLASGAVAMLLVPETAAGGAYPNSTVLAAMVMVAAMVIARPGAPALRLVAAGLLVGTAGWLRADAVLITPALIPLLAGGGARASARRILLVGGVAVATAAAAGAASGADLASVAREAGEHLGGGVAVTRGIPLLLGAQSVRSALAFFPLAVVVLYVVGLLTLAKHRSWRGLATVVLGTVPVWLVFGPSLTSPKYLYYSIPFVLLGAFSTLGARRTPRAVAVVVAGLLLIGQAVVGVRADVRAKPWARTPGEFGPVVWSGTIDRGPFERVTLAIGPGTVVPTDDGPRLVTGTLFAPVVWHAFKREVAECERAVATYLRQPSGANVEIFTATWSARNAVEHLLWREGFRKAESWPRELWRAEGRAVTHTCRETYTYDWETRRSGLAHAASNRVLYVFGSGRERATVLDRLPARPVCDHDGVVCLAAWEVDLNALDRDGGEAEPGG